MTQDRRTFLKTSALAGAAAAAGVPFTATAPLAQKASVGAQTMPRGFVFATLRRQNGYGLGVRTGRGVLDVVAAEADLKEGAPTTYPRLPWSWDNAVLLATPTGVRAFFANVEYAHGGVSPQECVTAR